MSDLAATKEGRVALANALLVAIAQRGRKFFAGRHGVGHFALRPRAVWFFDAESGEWVFPYTELRWRHFSGGGTLRRLVEALRDFIRFGTPVSEHHFGPWPHWICGGDLWGYGEPAMGEIREVARRLSITTPTRGSSACATTPAVPPNSATSAP